ncbi:hypothetical protein GUJ93_ZPchr0012g22078 [Zizania palustris]|uniref:C2 domain-containing protein n=1 Tax=Zizania palustris TaxID=103762 RepID=A0A8J6BZ04_ZIZPA|nr:hypothetical protein GUJ93_ZPchr0012g22078 [Zizania palustris]
MTRTTRTSSAGHEPVAGGAVAQGAAGLARSGRRWRHRRVAGHEKPSSTYDLVEQMFFLYVRVVKAKDLPPNPITGSPMDPSNVLAVYLKDKEMIGRDDYVGKVVFDLAEVPTRVPPDSPLAPQWYRLEERRGEGGKVRGELMLAVWIGTQADEAFPGVALRRRHRSN